MVAFGDAVSAFGLACKSKLAGPGDEARDTDRAVRPDCAIAVGGAITGYIEVKRPGASVDPDSQPGLISRIGTGSLTADEALSTAMK